MSETVYSFIDYWKAVLEQYNSLSNNQQLIFRGHSNDTYKLLPTAMRSDDYTEKEVYNNAIVENPEEFKKNEHLSNLVKIQHFSSFTRLLDFTYNPLTALYFAAEQSPDDAGEVILYKINKNDILPHTSDKVLMLACLAVFTPEEQEEIKAFCESHPYAMNKETIKDSHIMRKFLHEIRSEFPAFEMEIVGEDLLNSYFVRAKKDNERMKSQDGLFCICGLDRNKLTELESKVIRITIPSSIKKDILKELDYMGITTSSIYPNFERRMQEMLDNRVQWHKIAT